MKYYKSLHGFIILLCNIKYGYSIFCYDCNSLYDPRCGDKFDPFSLGVVNCSLRDPPEHIDAVEPTICRTIKMEVYGEVRVVRQCGYIQNEPGQQQCHRFVGDGDVFVTYCSCDTDLCNSTPQSLTGISLISLVLSLCNYFIGWCFF